VRGVRDGFAVDDDVPVDKGAIFRPLSVDRVVLGEVRGGFARAGELVDVDELELGVVVREAEREASDATETWEVDGEVETAGDRSSVVGTGKFVHRRSGWRRGVRSRGAMGASRRCGALGSSMGTHR